MKLKTTVLIFLLAVIFVNQGNCSYKMTNARLISRLSPFYSLGVRLRTESNKLNELYWQLWSLLKSHKVTIHTYGDEDADLKMLFNDIADLDEDADKAFAMRNDNKMKNR